MDTDVYQIRNATIDDAADMSELSSQLGYPSSTDETKERLESILNSEDHIIIVAHIYGNKVIAWIHAYKRQSVESGHFAEIGGLIVSKTYREKGIGTHLMKSIEKWTMQKKLPKLRVRTQIHRDDAEQFYLNMGFKVTKKQSVFDKTMQNVA